MAPEKVKELVKAVGCEPQARETLQNLIKSADKDGIVSFFAEAAKRLGIDVTEEDILETVTKEERNQKSRTEESIAGIEKMPDDGLDQVAGGGPICSYAHDEMCRDTYQDRENCWMHDGCDKNIDYYDLYKCHYTYQDAIPDKI